MQRSVPLSILSAPLLLAILAGCMGTGPGSDDGVESTPPPVTESIVGKEPFTGPATAAAMSALCDDLAADAEIDCYLELLKDLLVGRGAEAAFWTLENLTVMDADVRNQGHPIAHDLGAHALEAYGSIHLALAQCSYKVFAGCFHGSLESYFSKLDKVTKDSADGLCPSDNRFREYTCLHGVGHGLMMNTRNDLEGSLELCDGLDTWFGRHSCYGGVFMQNVVGYFDSLQGVAHEHDHGHGEITYAVDAEDPYYPCVAVDEEYKSTCWLMQTSLILHFNRGDFQATAVICENEPDGYMDHCFRSYGRDVAPYTDRNLERVIEYCNYPSTDLWDGLCMAGFVSESILNFADPQKGLEICAQVPANMQAACYEEAGKQARNMLGTEDAVTEFCLGAGPDHVADCRRGGDLD